jgi:hypothetical protein
MSEEPTEYIVDGVPVQTSQEPALILTPPPPPIYQRKETTALCGYALGLKTPADLADPESEEGLTQGKCLAEKAEISYLAAPSFLKKPRA